MKIKALTIPLLLTIILGACSVNKKSRNHVIPSFSLTFGKTGGFTNINPIYSINNTGDLFKQATDKADPVPVKKLSSASLDSIYLLLKQTDFLSQPISHTGNISSYLELKMDTLQRKIMWTESAQLPPACLKLHLYLMETIKNK